MPVSPIPSAQRVQGGLTNGLTSIFPSGMDNRAFSWAPFTSKPRLTGLSLVLVIPAKTNGFPIQNSHTRQHQGSGS